MAQLELNRCIVGDSDLIMPELIERGMKFDLILTDPPYNLNKDFGNDSDSLELEEFIRKNTERIRLCHKLLGENGSLIWFGIHKYVGFLQVAMYEDGLFYRGMNIWNYKNGFSRSKKVPATTYEPFLWFSNNDKNWVYNADDVRVPYESTARLKTPVYYKDKNGNRKAWNPDSRGALRSDIWQYPTLAGKAFAKERTAHPAQKPEALITDLLRAFCPKDKNGMYAGTVLDPFHGSGTLGVCCEKLNQLGHHIEWLGIEIEKKWVDVANERLARI